LSLQEKVTYPQVLGGAKPAFTHAPVPGTMKTR
jgi:hypothetical protein